MSSSYAMLLERIHTKERKILTTTLFLQDSCKICLLDFIGANSYFITENGVVFLRNKLDKNKNNIVAQNWVPFVLRDVLHPVPWVHLVTTSGKLWWPVNQLLGWAFSPYIEQQKKYFISSQPWIWGVHYQQYQWVDAIEPRDGALYNFMELLYQDGSKNQ